MHISPGNLIHHELIGLEVEVIDSSNNTQIGVKGKILDVTKNTLMIEVASGHVKVVPKSHTHFIFTIPAGSGRRYLSDTNHNRIEDSRQCLCGTQGRLHTDCSVHLRFCVDSTIFTI